LFRQKKLEAIAKSGLWSLDRRPQSKIVKDRIDRSVPNEYRAEVA
jgi:hypothetical protein